MAKAQPPMTWFRAFEAAARHLSFTRAAEELGLTQSAISQHVRALEQRLEQQLFVRVHRALQLTDAGRLLLPDVTAAIGLLGQATERFLPQTTRPRLKIATSASVAQHVLARALQDFHARFPDIALEIVTTVWPDDFTAVSADIEIRFGTAELVGKDAVMLRPSELHIVGSPKVTERLAAGTRPEDIPLIQPVGISKNWTQILSGAEATYFVDTHGLSADIAMGGGGLALNHCLITRDAVADGRLRDAKMGKWPAKETYFLARNATSLPDAQQAFSDWLPDYLNR